MGAKSTMVLTGGQCRRQRCQCSITAITRNSDELRQRQSPSGRDFALHHAVRASNPVRGGAAYLRVHSSQWHHSPTTVPPVPPQSHHQSHTVPPPVPHQSHHYQHETELELVAQTTNAVRVPQSRLHLRSHGSTLATLQVEIRHHDDNFLRGVQQHRDTRFFSMTARSCDKSSDIYMTRVRAHGDWMDAIGQTVIMIVAGTDDKSGARAPVVMLLQSLNVVPSRSGRGDSTALRHGHIYYHAGGLRTVSTVFSSSGVRRSRSRCHSLRAESPTQGRK